MSRRVSAGDSTDRRLPTIGIGPHFEMHPVVFPAGALIVISLVILTLVVPAGDLQASFEDARNWIGDAFGWLYVGTMSGFLILALWLAFGRYGHVRLGRHEDEPEFSRATWFAMLFSAGMGIGLVFWSVAEPIYHFQTPPPGLAEGLEPSRVAMAVTIFHWGLHPWALYSVVGLALAYYGFRREMPLGFRSLLHPILGDRVWGRLGDAIDTLAIIATLTGVATSLGIGAQQVNAGLAYLLGVPINTPTQITLIAVITGLATVSVVLGLATGIRRLSELNMVLAGGLMIIVILASGLVAFLGSSIENLGAYVQMLPFSSFRTGASNQEGRAWLSSWTVFYWAWWISWSPFVGMFIARVSRGRTIREFVVGTLVVPTLVGIVWLTAFGSSTLRQHTDHLDRLGAATSGDIAYDPADSLPTYQVGVVDPQTGALGVLEDETYQAVERPLTAVEYLGAPVLTDDHTDTVDQLPTVMFAMLEGQFDSRLLTLLAVIVATSCIVLFFVTSSDSASMVIDIIASGGNPDPPVGTRLFWAISEGVVAATLLLAGGLHALQAASITVALPFTVILLGACVGLVRSLRAEEMLARRER